MRIQLAAVLLLFIGCKPAEEKKETVSMPGVYTMTLQHVKGSKIDSTYTDYKQLKIYTSDFMMYAGMNPKDSMSGFGIGAYSANGDSVLEVIHFNASDTSSAENPLTATLIIEKTPKGYKQYIGGMKSGTDTLDLTEEYDSVGTGETSQLDGAWMEVKAFNVKGSDTTMANMTQFKTFGGGHFIWGHVWQDSAKVGHAGIGYGTFKINGNKLTEKVDVSTYSQARGQSYDIDFTMDGPDGFTQVLTSPDGTKSYEVYTRMKK
jgi:hypothetical protein